jgi:hypothetical protein
MIKQSALVVRSGFYTGSFHFYSVLVICIMGINYLFTKYVNVIITYDIFIFCGIMAIDTVFLEFYHVRLISCVPHCQLLD